MLLVIFTELLLQILTGHQDNAEFALAMCPTQPYVLSGGWETCFFFFFYSLLIVLVTLYLKSLFIHCVGYSVSEKTELHFRKRQNSRVVEY